MVEVFLSKSSLLVSDNLDTRYLDKDKNLKWTACRCAGKYTAHSRQEIRILMPGKRICP